MTSAFDVIVQDDAMPDEPDMGFFLAWLDALRSGGYPQSSSMLRTSEGYCCLGVACNVHPHTYPTTSGYTFEGSTDYQRMPKELRDRIGLPPDFEQELIDMNDVGSDFDDIADVIEEELDKFWRRA